MMSKKIILYIVAGILIVGLVLLTIFPGMVYTVRDSGSSSSDKCSPAEGYTAESWKEHMSHHPNLYRECLT